MIVKSVKPTIHASVQGTTTGRLLSYNPKTKKTHVLADGLFYANGVALSPDESFVLVVETLSVTIHKYWLKGPKVCSLSLHCLSLLTAVAVTVHSGRVPREVEYCSKLPVVLYASGVFVICGRL